ncbi:AAA family ATPase [Peptoniphilus harei]|uniref:AAA family ATPase n=1 Tax=Peptoniphilus harei TaxID=54005 RepID=UPI00254AA809|nr:AAA family ATPase [Peptoniphilus harei]MDK7354610.1 AAA family ATPase [Peptoniphilus harei]MDK7370515.1 AAA family ATPase [Peptoniphilus harei]
MEYLKEIYKINIEDFEEYSYLRNIPSLKSFQGIKIEKPVTFFVGENGSGKSTLLEAIAIALGLNPEGGSKNFNFATKETHSELGKLLEIARGSRREEDGFFLRAESFYNLATEVEELNGSGFSSLYDSYGGKSLHDQSHGESFRSLILNRFRSRGIYLLDEPEAALSPTSQMSLLCIIDELVKKDTQFIIASHSPIILAYPNADIYEFSEAGIEKKSYKETESYSVTKAFLDDPERMMNFLFDD